MMMLGKKLQSLITIFKAREKEYCLKISYEEERVQVRLRWREGSKQMALGQFGLEKAG